MHAAPGQAPSQESANTGTHARTNTGTDAAQAGMTLLELLAALVLSSLVLVLGADLFRTGQRQFFHRTRESEMLHRQYLLRQTLRAQFKEEISLCDRDGLRVRAGDGDRNVAVSLRERFPGLESLVFQCFELDGQGELVPWKTSARPRLIEYEWTLEHRGLRANHRGSWLH